MYIGEINNSAFLNESYESYMKKLHSRNNS